MVSRQAVVDNLINNPVYFNKSILKKKNELLKSDMRNFLEIYSILIRTFIKTDDYNSDIILSGCKLLKKHRNIFWDNPEKYDEDYGTYTDRVINNWFHIRETDLDQLVDLVIMPTLKI